MGRRPAAEQCNAIDSRAWLSCFRLGIIGLFGGQAAGQYYGDPKKGHGQTRLTLAMP
jgi:hypothetical protein